jgi:hypothetical protein
MRLIASAVMTLAFAGSGSLAQAQNPQAQTLQAQTLKVSYDITLAGLPLGKADLSSSFNGPKYEMEGRAKLTGLAMILTGGKGEASASGSLAGETPRSSKFAVVSKTSDNQRSVRMGLKSGRVAPGAQARPGPGEARRQEGRRRPHERIAHAGLGLEETDRSRQL